ncbi:hypothetical protein HKD37_07G019693 [Glycine soja]
MCLLNLMQHPMRCLVFKHEGEIVVSDASLETLASVRRGWWCCDSMSGWTTGGGVSEVCGGAVIAPVCHCLQNQKVMSRKENLISELHTRKGTWKIVVRITDLWQARKQNSKQTIEMVLIDQTGSKIGATLWQELFTELRDKLQCGSSYLIQNLRIVDNQSEYRVSPAPYLVYFLKTTSVKEIHRPEIPSNIYLITPFSDIISGLAPRHTLVDIVGVVADFIDVKKVNPPHRMTVRLRDNSNCDILITVWEDYAIQLDDAIDKNLLLQEPLVVMLTLGKIKDATSVSGVDKYPLSVQNIKFGSKLYVNADITEIHEFRQSQSNVVEKFMQNAQVVSIGEINNLRQDCYCLTVGTVDEIIIEAPWSYDSCPNCTTTFDPSKGGSACRSCHTRWSIMGTKETSFSGMQHESSCLAGDDIKVFPTCVDEILFKTWVVRFKFRSQLRQSSVLDVSEELHHIQSLIATLGLKEQSSKGKGIAVEPESSPPIFVPMSSDYDPENSTCLTPTKRISCQQTSSDFDSDEHTQYQLSNNKHIKADQLLQKSNYSWTYMLNEGSVGKLFYKNEKDNCISQCSPTINHNNNPATSFQSTPPSHRTLSINDSEHCSKRHTVNVSSIQRNLMSSFEDKKNRTTASTSTCQGSNPYSNMTQLDIHRDKHERATNTTQHNQFVAHDSSHSTDNDDDQFVGDDSSDSTDNDINMTQENIDIEYSLNDPTIDDLDDYDVQTFPSASSAYQNTGGTYIDIGDPVWECPHCKAMMWYDERINKDKQTNKPRILKLRISNKRMKHKLYFIPEDYFSNGLLMDISQKLNYVRQHQQQLRVDKYINLTGSNDHPETLGRDRGKRIIQPSSFVGSQRYMEQLYFDGMTICGHLGFPDLFLTMTCNPTWPKIQRKVTQSNLTPNNCPDIITQVFKIKLNQLMNDLKHGNIFGNIIGCKGFPHAHILIFLHPSNKLPNPDDIDQMISAEIPDKQTQAQLFEIVSNHMMHGPCGFANKKSPCMVNGKCIRCFPKKFHGATIVDQDGFPVYRRRNDGRTIMKNGIELDNRFVVPYNPQLLLKYKTHLNVEWCNQSTSIKYLFKYINKGSDHIIASLGNQDEIKQYLDCRYVSPPKACWKIFAFPMHARSPAVERLYFHLENQQHVMSYQKTQSNNPCSQPGCILTKYILMDGILHIINISQDLFMSPAKDASNQENKGIQ